MSDMGSLVDAWEQAIRRAAHDAVDTPESAYDWGASDHKAALLSAIAALVAERDSYQRQIEGMRAKCEAMQHIVNCASAFASTDEDGGSDDEDYIEQLFEALRDYRAALQSDSKDGAP